MPRFRRRRSFRRSFKRRGRSFSRRRSGGRRIRVGFRM